MPSLNPPGQIFRRFFPSSQAISVDVPVHFDKANYIRGGVVSFSTHLGFLGPAFFLPSLLFVVTLACRVASGPCTHAPCVTISSFSSTHHGPRCLWKLNKKSHTVKEATDRWYIAKKERKLFRVDLVTNPNLDLKQASC